MIKIDLITGFLGAGKTTFIKKYASYLMKQGRKIGILENDFGAVNVDMLLLQDLEGDNCSLEMIAGGCDADCHRRRFKTKLIAMAMSGYDRVIIEPSGIYDVDEFFDALYEEPLDRFYEPGNVIALVDAGLEEDLSKEAKYLLATEVADAGCVLFSKCDEVPEKQLKATLSYLNQTLEQPVANYKSNSFTEVGPNLTLDGHTLGVFEVLITDNAFDTKLAENQQQVLLDASKICADYCQQISGDKEAEVIEQLKAEGVNVIEVEDKTAWREACSPIVEEYTKGELGELYNKILSIK